jgi:hypothetical protein
VSDRPILPDPLDPFTQAVNRRDFDTLVSLFTPDSVCDFSAWGIGSFDGPSAIRGFAEDLLGTHDDNWAEATEVRPLGHGVVLVAYRERARPVGSHAHLEWRRVYVALLRDGLIERLTWYTDIDKAHAAAERLAEERE